MRRDICARRILVAGAAAAVITLSAAAGASAAPDAEMTRSGCLGDAETWLPGALQIDDRGRPAPSEGSAGESLRATVSPDCAVV